MEQLHPRPRIYTILTMPREVWDFCSAHLMDPPTVEGYQKAMAALQRAMARHPSRYSQDVVYNLLSFLKSWSLQKGQSGRPPTYETREEFVGAITLALMHIVKTNRYGQKIGKTAIATELGTTYRLLRTWEVKFGVNVKMIIKEMIDPKKI